MCQIHIIKRDDYLLNQSKYDQHLKSGASANDHGCSALFINNEGNHSLIRSLKFDVISDLMTINDDWEQVVIHQRYTTQGAANLPNTHMWQVGNYFYCHNGVLRDKDCYKFEVDSQIIGSFLESDNVWDAIAYCQSEDYANTFIINLETKKIWVTRSNENTLYTDGSGQYSTKKLFGEIDVPMPKYSVEIINLNIQPFDKWGGYDAYEYDRFLSKEGREYVDTRTHEEKVADSTQGNTKEEIPADTGDDLDAVIDEIQEQAADDEDIRYDISQGSLSLIEIERDLEAGFEPSLEDVIELEKAMHIAIADGNEINERKYNYLLEKAHGNG